MDKIFTEMFSRQPDEVFYGDYFYHSTQRKNVDMAKIAEQIEIPLEKLIERRINSEALFISEFKERWKHYTLQGELHPYYDDSWIEVLKGKNKDIRAEEIINKLAVENKPFMDIASSRSMGLAPYIIKMNPKILCLVTDISKDEMKILRSCADEHLTEYNINIASFDNLDIPIKNNSLNYITSKHGVTSSCEKPADGQKTDIYQFSTGKEKVINEIYRILKPEGQFITLEMNRECDYDLQKLYSDYNEHGKLFGLYTYEEIQAVCELLVEKPWRDKFISAGFQIEVEKTIYKKCSLYRVMNFLHYFTNYHGIHHWEKRTWDAQRRTENWVWNINDYDAENAGFDLYETDTFFVLKKNVI